MLLFGSERDLFLLLVISDRGAGVARSERTLLTRAGGVQVHLCQQDMQRHNPRRSPA